MKSLFTNIMLWTILTIIWLFYKYNYTWHIEFVALAYFMLSFSLIMGDFSLLSNRYYTLLIYRGEINNSIFPFRDLGRFSPSIIYKVFTACHEELFSEVKLLKKYYIFFFISLPVTLYTLDIGSYFIY